MIHYTHIFSGNGYIGDYREFSRSLVKNNAPFASKAQVSGNVKFFLPPGTCGLTMSVQTYAADLPCTMSARTFEVPMADSLGFDVDDTRQTLARLVAGDQLYFYGPPRSGGLAVSNQQEPITPTEEPLWLYMDWHTIPGDKLISLQISLQVDAAMYQEWYSNAQWDADGGPLLAAPADQPETLDQRTLRYIGESGLAPAMKDMTGCRTDEAMVDLAVKSGTWAALQKMVELAEAGR